MVESADRLVLIIGCGQLGSRHLQAVASLPSVRHIEVVDPRPEALELGRQRLDEMPDQQPSINIRWLTSLEEATKGGDLCIEATQSPGRCQRVCLVWETLGYSSFLLEKIVSQSTGEINDLVGFSRENGLSVWVNCQGRARPFHQRVKRILDPADPIIFSVVGGNQGLATNGIHHADLFVFYDETSCIRSAGSHVDPVLHPSKRGTDLFDLSGTLQGYSDKGSHFTLSYAGDHDSYEHFTISTRSYRCIVDHWQRWAIESDESSGWAWKPVPYESNLFVSEVTKTFASQIFDSGDCDLPTLEESLVSHRYILDELRPHFNNLLGRDVAECPVT